MNPISAPAPAASLPSDPPGSIVKRAGLFIALAALLAILAFAVVVWMTEALDYAVSSVVMITLAAPSGRRSQQVKMPG